MSRIPTKARSIVKERDEGSCLRCGGPGTDIHHRQRRRDGGHGIENLVLLCSTDHRAVHSNPSSAYKSAFIVRSSVPRDMLWAVPVNARHGASLLLPSGTVLPTQQKRLEDAHEWHYRNRDAIEGIGWENEALLTRWMRNGQLL